MGSRYLVNSLLNWSLYILLSFTSSCKFYEVHLGLVSDACGQLESCWLVGVVGVHHPPRKRSRLTNNKHPSASPYGEAVTAGMIEPQDSCNKTGDFVFNVHIPTFWMR